jgi:hypothetical protein
MMKTNELIGVILDRAVAECEEVTLSEHEDGPCSWLEHEVTGFWVVYSPSTDWGQGGPLIEREKMQIYASASQWTASDFFGKTQTFGPTPLIAAMRCYVASKLGDEIEIPKELR